MSDFNIGDRVKYTKRYSENHIHVEFGVITSIKNDQIWVRYDIQNPTANGQLTPIDNLIKVK